MSRFFGMFIALVIIAVSTLLPTPSAAQSSNRVTIDAIVGFENAFFADTFAPVRLVVNGDNRDRTVTIEWVVSDDNGTTVAWQKDLNLPAQSRKFVNATFVLPGYSRSIVARVRDSDGRIVASTMVDAQPVFDSLHVVVSSNTNLLRALSQPDPSISMVPEVRHITVDLLPSQVTAFHGVTTLFIDDPSQLSVAQADAVRTWMTLGGTLVVAGTLTGPLADMALVTPQATMLAPDALTLPPQAPAPWPVAVSVPAVTLRNPDATQVIANVPLLWQANMARGRMFHSSVAFAATQDWPGQRWLWQAVIEPIYPSLVSTIGYANTYQYNEPLSASLTIPSLSRPAPMLLVAIIALYIALIGPATYFVLKRRGQLDWAWVVIPIIAVALSGSLIAVGIVQRGSSVLLYHLTIVQQHATATKAYASTTTALYTPFRSTFRTQIAPVESLRLLTVPATTSVQTARDDYAVDIVGNIGSVQYIATNQHITALSLTSALTRTDQSIRGDVVLHGNSALSDAGILYQDQYYPLGDLRGGIPSRIDPNRPAISFPCDITGDAATHIDKNRLFVAVFGPCGAMPAFRADQALLIGWSTPTVAVPAIADIIPQAQPQLHIITIDLADE